MEKLLLQCLDDKNGIDKECKKVQTPRKLCVVVTVIVARLGRSTLYQVSFSFSFKRFLVFYPLVL